MSWLPVEMKKAILMIGEETKIDQVRPAGSASLIQYQGSIYVVSAKHVIENLRNPVITFNNLQGGITGRKTSDLTEHLGYRWISHPDPNVDIAIIPFGTDISIDDILAIDERLLYNYEQIYDGEDIFFMGFPLSLSSRQKITPVIRQGCIALKFDEETRIEDIIYPKKTFIIDGQVSSGNSGSPVFRKPSFIDMANRSIGKYMPPVFMGIITSHIASTLYDFNNRPIARENSGLGIVSSINHIKDLLDSIAHM